MLKKPIHQKIKGEVEMIDYEEQKLYDVLNQLSIKFTRYEHEAVYTVEEADNLDIDIPGQHSKNLFLRNKKEIFIIFLCMFK